MLHQSGNIPVIEVFWSLVDKADKKFSKIRDLPYYERNRYGSSFYKVFNVYTQLWKFQQENRQKLVEAGLKRWEIGEIASRIAQLYYGQYMRTSDASFLAESYIFNDAILTREYFKEGMFQDSNLANKQLRFLARFLMVCLVLNRRETVHQLVYTLRLLVDECKTTFQDNDFKEWKIVLQEIARFLRADTTFMNIRPLRYSLVLDPHPDTLLNVATPISVRNLRLRDAVISSYHHNEVKFSELTLDTFRILQCLEWEPSGSFYQSNDTKAGQDEGFGPIHISFSQDILDPALPANPRKTVLYRPSVTHVLAVLATLCEELPSDGVLLIYLSSSGRTACENSFSSANENIIGNAACSDSTSSFASNIQGGTPCPSRGQSKGDCTINEKTSLYFGTRENGGFNCIYPSDLIPFTRRPLFVVIDSDASEAFKMVNGAEKGETAALLLSPTCSIPTAAADPSHQPSGSLFTIFLTAPLQAFCILLGISSSNIDMEKYKTAEALLSSSMNDLGLDLETTHALDPVWGQILGDPFLRRLLLRFLFCRSVLACYRKTYGRKEYHPECIPCLADCTLSVPNALVLGISEILSATNNFIFT